jgi:hypothetical protein
MPPAEHSQSELALTDRLVILLGCGKDLGDCFPESKGLASLLHDSVGTRRLTVRAASRSLPVVIGLWERKVCVFGLPVVLVRVLDLGMVALSLRVFENQIQYENTVRLAPSQRSSLVSSVDTVGNLTSNSRQWRLEHEIKMSLTPGNRHPNLSSIFPTKRYLIRFVVPHPLASSD